MLFDNGPLQPPQRPGLPPAGFTPSGNAFAGPMNPAGKPLKVPPKFNLKNRPGNTMPGMVQRPIGYMPPQQPYPMPYPMMMQPQMRPPSPGSYAWGGDGNGGRGNLLIQRGMGRGGMPRIPNYLNYAPPQYQGNPFLPRVGY